MNFFTLGMDSLFFLWLSLGNMKEKINKIINLKKLMHGQIKTISKVKIQMTNLEKRFAIHIADRGLISLIYKELEKDKNSVENGQNIRRIREKENRCFLKIWKDSQ